MIRCTITLIVLGVLTVPVTAQFHGGDWTLAGMGTPSLLLGRIDGRGRLSSVVPASRLPNSFLRGAVMGADNDHYVLAANVARRPGFTHLVRIDRVGTVVQSFTLPPPVLRHVHDVAIDQNGDLIALDAGYGVPGGLYKVDRQGVMTTVMRWPVPNAESIVRDVDTGDWIFVAATLLYGVNPARSQLTTIARLPGQSAGQLGQHLASGDLFVSVNGRVFPYLDLVRIRRSGAVSTLVTAFGISTVSAIGADRASAPRPRLVVGRMTFSDSSVVFVDIDSGTVTGLWKNSSPPWYLSAEIFRDRGREVATIRTAPARWDIRLSLPGEGGNAYAVGLSLSGVRPGVPLVDGRSIPLRVDYLTVLSLTGRLGALLTGNVGYLNSRGVAFAQLDVQGFPQLKGLRVWIQAITFHPSAPLGVSRIADPVVLVL